MSLYTKGLHDYKEHLTLYVPLSIIFQSCLGGIAAMFILANSTHGTFHFLDLILVTSFAMAYNGALYAEMKPKVLFNLFVLTVFVHTLFLIINMIRLA